MSLGTKSTMVCASREKDVYSRIEVTAHGRRVNPGIFGDRGQRDVADSTGCRESACRIKEVAPIGIKVTIIEPGAFRTDWAGDSMATTDTLHEDYQPTVGAMIESVRASSGKQPGDPARAAKIILDIAGTEEPPLRLLLGRGALQLARDVLAHRSAEDEKWAAVTESADFPS